MRKTVAMVSVCTFVLTFFTGAVPLVSENAAYGADISGVVTLKDARPKRKPIRTDADPKCSELHADEPLLSDQIVVNDEGKVQWTFVYIKNSPDGDYPIPSEPAVLDQEGCTYTPHVQGMRAGQQLDIKNSDPLLHNVRSFGRRNRPFNFGQPTPGIRSKEIDKPEKAIKFKCDVHKWMTGYIFAMEHPFFATTDEHGAFTIKDVPPGEYTLVAWHEVMDEIEIPITVGSDDVTDANFGYVPPSRD